MPPNRSPNCRAFNAACANADVYLRLTRRAEEPRSSGRGVWQDSCGQSYDCLAEFDDRTRADLFGSAQKNALPIQNVPCRRILITPNA
jgi:hypothetical protein